MTKHRGYCTKKRSSYNGAPPNFRVAVLATDGFEEAELTEPVKALKDADAEVTVLSLKPGQIQGVRHDLDKTVKVKVETLARRTLMRFISPVAP